MPKFIWKVAATIGKTADRFSHAWNLQSSIIRGLKRNIGQTEYRTIGTWGRTFSHSYPDGTHTKGGDKSENPEVADLLYEIVNFFQIEDIQYKPRAYQTAARDIESISEPVEDVYDREEVLSRGETYSGSGHSFPSCRFETVNDMRFVGRGPAPHIENVWRQGDHTHGDTQSQPFPA